MFCGRIFEQKLKKKSSAKAQTDLFKKLLWPMMGENSRRTVKSLGGGDFDHENRSTTAARPSNTWFDTTDNLELGKMLA